MKEENYELKNKLKNNKNTDKLKEFTEEKIISLEKKLRRKT